MLIVSTSDNQKHELLTDYNARHGCNITGIDRALRRIDRDLVCQTPSNTTNYLVYDPLACACPDVQ